MSRVVDLDAARAAREEKAGPKPVVVFGGREWTLPGELPWALAEAAASGSPQDALNAVRSLLGPDQWPDFVALGLTISDVQVLIEGIAAIYMGSEAQGKE